jgi:hypothetical protein
MEKDATGSPRAEEHRDKPNLASRLPYGEATAETFRWDPAGNQSRPAELGQRPEASLAWCRGDPGCEA